MYRTLVSLFALVTLSLIYLVPASYAATITVNDNDDGFNSDGNCNLREAIRAANLDSAEDGCTAGSGDDDIVFDSSITGTITYTQPDEIVISTSLTITGPGADQLTIDAEGQALTLRAFSVDSPAGGATVSMSGLTITDGNPAAEGGAIQVDTGDTLNLSNCILTNNTVNGSLNAGAIDNKGTMTIDNCTLSNNTATDDAGAIQNSGTLTINNSIVSGNSAGTAGSSAYGGAIYNGNGATLTVTNSTFSNNEAGAASSGGAINNVLGGTVTITNATLSGNSAGSGGAINNLVGGTVTFKNTIVANSPSGGNCSGTITSDGNNIDSGASCALGGSGDLSSTDPLLGSLQDNGGPTRTHALLSGSPAIDAGTNTGCPSTDQRGFSRPVGSNCDIGAYEKGTCGDGFKEPEETCDDGNTDNSDACLNTCVAASCGDGFTQTGVEGCDDGNADNSDACLDTCVSATCGDGSVQASVEDCDNGASNSDTEVDACRSNCTNARCGDSVVDTNEACDDGNATDLDGCSSSCNVEDFDQLENANPNVDFANYVVGQTVSLDAPDPASTSPLVIQAQNLPATCTCTWSISDAALGSYSDTGSCKTALTLTAEGIGTLTVAVDCGMNGSGTFLQTFIVSAATGAAGSGGGCSLISNAAHHSNTNVLYLFISSYELLRWGLLGHKAPLGPLFL